MSRIFRSFYQNKQAGGAAVEYIIVSVFGLVIAIGAITLVGKAAQAKLNELEERLGLKLDADLLNPFGA